MVLNVQVLTWAILFVSEMFLQSWAPEMVAFRAESGLFSLPVKELKDGKN